MSTPVKRSSNQSKHRTKAEIMSREFAEQSTCPDRPNGAKLSKPKGLTGAAGTYWESIVSRLEGAALLDDLDREMLAGYCCMLARRDKLNRLLTKLLQSAVKADSISDSSEDTDKLDALVSKLDKLDRTLLTYASKLGFTPEGRVRLAQKRAQAAMEDAAELDMFGD